MHRIVRRAIEGLDTEARLLSLAAASLEIVSATAALRLELAEELADRALAPSDRVALDAAEERHAEAVAHLLSAAADADTSSSETIRRVE